MFLAVLLVALIAVVGVLVAVAAQYGGGGGYGWDWMMGGGWGSMWVVGSLMMLIPILALVLLLALLFRPSTQNPILLSPTPPVDATTTVRMRYARGEITSEQYRQILSDLQRVP
jgi:uncharacterized membrane protein